MQGLGYLPNFSPSPSRGEPGGSLGRGGLFVGASCPPRDDELSFSAQGRRDDEAGEKSLRGRGVSGLERKPLVVAMCEFIWKKTKSKCVFSSQQ